MGLIERPFIYVFDGTGLTDGQDALHQVVNMDGTADFLLRRVSNFASLAPSFNIYDDANQQPLMWSPSGRGMVMQNNYAMAQTWRYRKDGHIYFDLFNVARTFTACGGQPIYTSYLTLQGATIVPDSVVYKTPYDYCGWP